MKLLESIAALSLLVSSKLEIIFYGFMPRLRLADSAHSEKSVDGFETPAGIRDFIEKVLKNCQNRLSKNIKISYILYLN